MDFLAPLPLKTKLAGNPSIDPQYAVSLQGPSGKEYKLSDPTALRAMVALMDMQAVMGGAASHFGGPAALAELCSALFAIAFGEGNEHKKPWSELYNVVNDAGHCENILYAVKANYRFANLELGSLKGFRSISSPLTGHGEAHLFPEGVLLSNGPLGSAFPQSQGLCYADALAHQKQRVTVTIVSDGASFEGEAKEAFAAIPGMAAKGQMAPFVAIISDNNTKLSGRIDEDSFDMQPTFRSLSHLGWKVIELAQGNDLKSCLHTLETAFEAARQDPKQPIAIHAKTVKGFGIKKLMEAASGGHGFPLKTPHDLPDFLQELYGKQSVPDEFVDWMHEMQAQFDEKQKAKKAEGAKTDKIQVGISQVLIEKAKAGVPLISLTSDLPGSTGVAAFRKEFPGRSIDVGVAEANMVSMAAGASKMGYVPVVDTFAQFGVTKGALPLTMASLSEAPVIAVFSHTGFQDAADGASHQALSYLAMVASIPQVKVFALTCQEEAHALMGQAIDEFVHARKNGDTPYSYVFFLGRETFPLSYQSGAQYKLGRAQVVLKPESESPQVVIAAAGSVLPQAIKASMELAAQGVGAIVVNPSCLNEPDVETFRELLAQTDGRLVTVEDHQLVAGMGAILSHRLLLDGISVKLKSLAVQGTFGQSAYKASELYAKHGLDARAIVQACQELVRD